MSIGAQNLTTANINNQLGNWSVFLRDMFANNQALKVVLDGIGLAGLQAAPFSFSAGDAQAVINCYNDLDKLRLVYYGLDYINPGATVNTGVITANDATHFGYNFDINIGKASGMGF